MRVGCFLLFFFRCSLFLQPLLLEARFCDGEEKGALEAVLLAVLAKLRLRIRQDVASRGLDLIIRHPRGYVRTGSFDCDSYRTPAGSWCVSWNQWGWLEKGLSLKSVSMAGHLERAPPDRNPSLQVLCHVLHLISASAFR